MWNDPSLPTNKFVCRLVGRLSLHKSQLAHYARPYPGFCSMKRLRVQCIFTPPWMGY